MEISVRGCNCGYDGVDGGWRLFVNGSGAVSGCLLLHKEPRYLLETILSSVSAPWIYGSDIDSLYSPEKPCFFSSQLLTCFDFKLRITQTYQRYEVGSMRSLNQILFLIRLILINHT